MEIMRQQMTYLLHLLSIVRRTCHKVSAFKPHKVSNLNAHVLRYFIIFEETKVQNGIGCAGRTGLINNKMCAGCQ